MEWPPPLPTFEAYKRELEDAIALHPPFGDWLKRQWIVAREPLVGDLELLKRKYVEHTRAQKFAEFQSRCVAEYQLEECAEKFTTAREEYRVQLEAWLKTEAEMNDLVTEYELQYKKLALTKQYQQKVVQAREWLAKKDIYAAHPQAVSSVRWNAGHKPLRPDILYRREQWQREASIS